MKGWLRSLVLDPFHDVMAAMGQAMNGPRPGRAMILMVVSLIVTWFIYVPIHEMLHVAGCVATGGSVSELQVDWKYGGAILAKYFPFVKVGGDYAGRLTGFDDRGSDLIYLATDFGPFVLTVLFGVPLMLFCGRRRSPMLLGTAVVVGLAPIYNLPGDYFEMGSIITTRVVTLLGGGTEVAFKCLRSDDIFRLFEEVFTQAGPLGIASPGRFAAALVLIFVSLGVAILLAFLTYSLGRAFGCLFIRPRPAHP